jgi:cytochrome c oxidase subunit II
MSTLPMVLDPHGSNAHETAQIAWVLFAGGTLIFVLVIGLAVFAVFAPPHARTWLSGQRFIVGAGIVFPVLALSALLIYTFDVWGALARERTPVALRIEVTGEMWWWRVRYLAPDGSELLITANEIHIPVDRPIELALKSADVLHSLWVPQLSGKLDMIPGRTNVLRIRADTAGVYRGQCAEFCGAQHAKMAFEVVAHAVGEFDAWLAAQQRPAQDPHTLEQVQGMRLFLAQCAACHGVRGTSARGDSGPDLTHIGSRRRIAAGSLPNNVGTLAGWIAASQHLKPENRMPSFDRLTSTELLSLARYLESLR